ncbi:hypothetical protein SAMN04487936_101583 [Halobacillus dabanensis]|uniref:Permease n=1 Tax=Halobacillus dabanensis TaxID=240302 RepID=A0A1I3Q9T2_HALDA|nr:hypothetical protein SAMN04487936_101583 [Halobacillus dabanensis]
MKISVNKMPRKDIILGLIFIVVLYITLPYFGIDSFSVVLALISIVEWGTKYILPWIVLYWGVRLIKRLESK